MNKALGELNALIASEIKQTEEGYTEWYRNSKFYRKPTLKDAFSEYIARDIEDFRKKLEEGSGNMEYFVKSFEDKAREYGASWFDEDLSMVRTGYELECRIYTTLRNIAAKKCDKPEADWQDFFEGKEYPVERRTYE